MIVGNSKTGRIKNFNTIYYVLKLLMTGKIKVLPVDKNLRLNLVPVDYVAQSVATIAYDENSLGKVYHLTCPKQLQPKAGELTEYLRSWAKTNLQLDIPAPVFAPASVLKKAGLSYNRKTGERKKNSVTNLLALMPYFFGNQDFDRSNTDDLIGDYTLNWQDYIAPLLDYACRKNFMHQTERTVFEQAKVRRASKSFPIHYYDVTADGIIRISGEEVNGKIQKIVDALWACGMV